MHNLHFSTMRLTPAEFHTLLLLRALFATILLTAVFTVSYHILFPTQILTVNFSSLNAIKNTIVVQEDDKNITLYAPTVVSGYTTLQLTLKPKKATTNTLSAFVTKEYQSQSAKNGHNIVGYPDGSLLASQKTYYIVWRNTIRPFLSARTVVDLGYNRRAFHPITAEEEEFYTIGETISSTEPHPLGTIFTKDGNYYQKTAENKITKYVSTQAFLSHFAAEIAIPITNETLASYTVADEQIGFSDGSILSHNELVGVVSGQSFIPIDSPETFTSFGWRWSDVVPVGGEVISLYKKQKPLTILSTHPDGTMFVTPDGTYTYKKDDQNQPFLSSAAAKAFRTTPQPITITPKTEDSSLPCPLHTSWFSSTLSCTLSITTLTNRQGNNYTIVINNAQVADYTTAEVRLSHSPSLAVAKESLALIKRRIFNRFGITQK